jgi:COP9 signalosome complex subunit 3
MYMNSAKVTQEANAGLAQAVIAHHHKLAIIRFANTCSAVSIRELATKSGLGQDDKAAQFINSMVQDGLFKAEIDAPVGDKPSVVRFIQSNGTLDVAEEKQLKVELLAQAARIKVLDSHVAEADHRLALTKEYAEHVRKVRAAKQEQKDAGVDDSGDVMDISAIAPMELGSEDESEMIDV